MTINQNKQAAIFVEETHYFEVSVDSLSSTKWKEAKGLIEVQFPYDGSIFDKDASRQEMLDLGEILVKRTDDLDAQPEKWPIKITAGKNWDYYLKSAKRAVCRAEYEIAEPQETMVDVQGEVLDIQKPSLADKDFSNLEAFQNSLQLKLEFWVPDLYRTRLKDKSEEIERLLLRREHTQQIFMQHSILNIEPNLTENLAKNLVALANTYGGTIIFGVDDAGKVDGLSEKQAEKIPAQVLRAVLQTFPIVPLQRAELHQTSRGKVYLIKVGSKERDIVYTAKGVAYRRKKKKTERMNVKIKIDTLPSSLSTLKSSAELLETESIERVPFKHKSNVAALDLEVSNDLNGLNLGRYICGMINANAHIDTATIIIRTPQQATASSANLTKKQVYSYVSSELGQITPKVSLGNITLKTTESYTFAIITIPIKYIPVALYGKNDKESGYIWKGEDGLYSISVANLLSNYSSGQHNDHRNKSLVNMETAYIEWPIRPPEKVSNGRVKVNGGDSIDFNVQHQALVWQKPIDSRQDTTGFQILLELPLNNATLTLDEKGHLVRHSPVVKGQFKIHLEDVLVSDCEISVVENDTEDETNYLQNLPIIKRTQIQLDLTAYLSELFKHRPKGSYIGFTLSQVTLDSDRAQDVIKACADMGFRLYTAPPNPASWRGVPPEIHYFGEEPYLENSRLLIPNGIIEGIRSQNYFDIQLVLGWVSTRSEITRELHYEDVYDTGTSNAHTVNFHIYLWGKDKAHQEIGQLQMGLYELIRRRLHQLGIE